MKIGFSNKLPIHRILIFFNNNIVVVNGKLRSQYSRKTVGYTFCISLSTGGFHKILTQSKLSN